MPIADEYFKLFKMMLKLEAKVENGLTLAKAQRAAKKARSLVRRADYLADAMLIPTEKRWTRGYK
jgi:hypothetical protein